jgi:hypothetical protein
MNDHDMGRWVKCNKCLGFTKIIRSVLQGKTRLTKCDECDDGGRIWLSLEEEVGDGRYQVFTMRW